MGILVKKGNSFEGGRKEKKSSRRVCVVRRMGSSERTVPLVIHGDLLPSPGSTPALSSVVLLGIRSMRGQPTLRSFLDLSQGSNLVLVGLTLSGDSSWLSWFHWRTAGSHWRSLGLDRSGCRGGSGRCRRGLGGVRLSWRSRLGGSGWLWLLLLGLLPEEALECLLHLIHGVGCCNRDVLVNGLCYQLSAKHKAALLGCVVEVVVWLCLGCDEVCVFALSLYNGNPSATSATFGVNARVKPK